MAEALRQAAADAGLRLTLLDACYLSAGLGPGGSVVTPQGAQRRFADADVDAWASRVGSLRPSPGMRVGVAAHSVRAVPRAALATVVEAAAGRPLHVHVAEQPQEVDDCRAVHGLSPVGLLAAEGVLGPGTTAVHATHVDDADVAALGRTGTGVCLCPTTERDLADGLGRALDLHRAGSPLSVGSDQHVVADLLEEARGVEAHERLRTGTRGCFTPDELLGAATAHDRIGWPEAGRLAVGALADLVAVRLDTVRTAGCRVEEVPLVAGAADVDTVVVGGREVVSGGHHVLGDVAALLADAVDAAPGPAVTAAGTGPPAAADPTAGSAGAVLVRGIGELVTNDPSLGDGSPLGVLRDAALVVEDGRVAWVGPAAAAPPVDRVRDLGGRAVVPGFVDSHTHLVFAGDRSAEFAARAGGQRYDGGGIASTVAATRAADDDTLRTLLRARVARARAGGTTTLEVKGGYGLTTPDEVRLLRLAGEVTTETTFLGAHVVPAGADRDAYVDLVRGEMLHACAPYARWVDVFCEPASPHAFDADEASAVLLAGRAAGLGLRVHGNQLGPGPGVRLAVELGAASVDHCTFLSDDDVDALAGSATVATLLPAVEFSTRMPYPDGRRLLDRGVRVALASDCNPGTAHTSSVPFVVALAVRECGLTPAEALHAATAGAAASLRRDDVGHLGVGARADLTVLDAPGHVHLAYSPGMPLARALDL